MPAAVSAGNSPSGEAWGRLKPHIEAFEKAWEDGDNPSVAAFLTHVLPADRLRLLVTLVNIDLERRLNAGEPARVEDYLHAYPDLHAERAALLALLVNEYHLRRHREPGLVLDEYVRRFPLYVAEFMTQLAPTELRDEPGRDVTNTAGLLGANGNGSGFPSLPGYEVLGELGRGTMGIVYRVRQVRANRVVALKVIRHGLQATAEELARFRAEAEAVARFQHPNIVQIYDVGEQAGVPYFAMEYVEGGVLDRRLNGTPWAVRAAAELLYTLAQGVEAAHTRGIVHRDLKPANVLLTANGIPKIVDFGLAKQLDSAADQTRSGIILGTPCYMAPEQAIGKGKHVGPAADVYALGSICYELLTGRPPFRAATTFDTILQVVSEEPVPPGRLQPKLPRDLEVICLRCLEKAPEKRYGSAAALGEDLRRFLGGEPILARPAPVWERSWKWVRRRPAAASLVALAVVAAMAVAGASVSLLYNNQLQEAFRVADEARRTAEEAKNQEQLARARAETQLYGYFVVTADREWSAGNVAGTRRLLGDCLPASRLWEWHFLKRLCQLEPLSFRGHTDGVNSLTFSPDGKRLASGSEDKTVIIWDVSSGQVVRKLGGHADGVANVSFSPDGGRLVSITLKREGTENKAVAGEIKVWDANTGQETLSAKGINTSVAFSPDSQRLAVAGAEWDPVKKERAPGEVKVWDLVTRQPLATLPRQKAEIYRLAFSPDGKRLVCACNDNSMRVYDLATGKLGLVFHGHLSPVEQIVFGPDGSRVTSNGTDGAVTVWDINNGEVLDRGLKTKVRSAGERILCFSDDSNHVAVRSQGFVDVVAVAGAGEETVRLPADETAALDGAFSPDASLLALIGKDKTVKVWQLKEASQFHVFRGHSGEVHAAAFSPDGRRVASGNKLFYTSAAGNEVVPTKPRAKLLPPSLGPGEVHVWDVASGRIAYSLTHPGPVWGLSFSGDGKFLASACGDRTVRLWDAVTGKQMRTLEGHGDVVYAVTFSPDGGELTSASRDHTIRIWDIATGKERLQLVRDIGEVYSVAYSRDGTRLATAGTDQTAKVWDALTGKELRQIRIYTEVESIAFSPDGTYLATAGRDGVVKVWDAVSGEQRSEFRGHTDAVTSVAFTPNGQRLASGGADNTVRIWGVTSGQELLTLREHSASIECVAFSRDGHRLVSASEDHTVRVWDGTPVSDEASK